MPWTERGGSRHRAEALSFDVPAMREPREAAPHGTRVRHRGGLAFYAGCLGVKPGIANPKRSKDTDQHQRSS